MSFTSVGTKTVKSSYLFIFITLILGCSFKLHAQNNSKTILSEDLNNNGIPEKIIQVEYTKPVQVPSKNEIRNGRYIKYILYRDGQKKGLTIFDFLIGDDESVYWEYKIEKVVDLNNDGWKDLIFYAGDDGGSKTIILIQKPDSFKAIYAISIGLDAYYVLGLDESNNIIHRVLGSKSSKILATWNAQRETFEGITIKWITERCDAYKEPDEKNEKLFQFFENDIVFNSDDSTETIDLWQKVHNASGEGWVETKCLANTPTTETFPEK